MEDLLRAIHPKSRLFLLSDFDGTIVPIAPTPDQAHLPNDVRHVLQTLASIDSIQLAIVSGRSLADLAERVPLRTLFLAGNHGAEILTPDGETLLLVDPDRTVSDLREVEAQLKEALSEFNGCIVENKGLSLALHTRPAAPRAEQLAVAHFTRLGDQLVRHGMCEWLSGKKILELRPVGMNKGRSVSYLLEQFGRAGELPLYLGDDLTDEDAFQVLAPSGLSILVSPEERPSHARYRLTSPSHVMDFLETLVEIYGA